MLEIRDFIPLQFIKQPLALAQEVAQDAIDHTLQTPARQFARGFHGLIDDHRFGFRARFQTVQRGKEQRLRFGMGQRPRHQPAKDEFTSPVSAQDAVSDILRRRSGNGWFVGQQAKCFVQALSVMDPGENPCRQQ
ncbi:hypothetical protein AGMMS50256_00340 [Betaproteobacteria bacterium]|nr:hypothetical protein AGMMS50256_00340 [Betaproteobacteria bacterium]